MSDLEAVKLLFPELEVTYIKSDIVTCAVTIEKYTFNVKLEGRDLIVPCVTETGVFLYMHFHTFVRGLQRNKIAFGEGVWRDSNIIKFI